MNSQDQFVHNFNVYLNFSFYYIKYSILLLRHILISQQIPHYTAQYCLLMHIVIQNIMHGSKFLISYSSENQIDMFDSVLSKKKEQLLSIRENLHSQATQIQKLGIQSPHLYMVWFGLVWFMALRYFSYILTVSCIGGGNRSTRRKPPTCRKSLIKLIT